jgi:hypothetical protein
MNNFDSKNNIVLAIYSHVEYYPPSLNLIHLLSKKNLHVNILCRNVFISDWDYPKNTNLIVSGKFYDIRKIEKFNFFKKTISFFLFTRKLLQLCLIKKPKYVILCDTMPTLSFLFILPFISKSIKIWYHNHDVLDLNKVKIFSLGWFSYFSEKALFKRLDLFTLPSQERIKYFPFSSFAGKYFFLPNYPRIGFFSNYKKVTQPDNEIRLLFQGNISHGHGIEEIINILNVKIYNKKLHLLLKGYCSENYRNLLMDIATKNNVLDQLEFQDFSNYKTLPTIMSSCHIGIAVYQQSDIMNSTIATASNKIYEYASLGLPILLYDNNYFKKYFSNYNFSVFTNLTTDDLLEKIKYLIQNYETLSRNAVSHVNTTFNFDSYFNKIDI